MTINYTSTDTSDGRVRICAFHDENRIVLVRNTLDPVVPLELTFAEARSVINTLARMLRESVRCPAPTQ